MQQETKWQVAEMLKFFDDGQVKWLLDDDDDDPILRGDRIV